MANSADAKRERLIGDVHISPTKTNYLESLNFEDNASVFSSLIDFMFLLSISGVDTIDRVEIYKKYMTFFSKN